MTEIFDEVKTEMKLGVFEDAVMKENKNRERNRFHARKARERKKKQIATMNGRIQELQDELTLLRQRYDEQNTASILLGMSSDANQENDSENSVIENILSKDLSTAYLISSSCEGSSGKRIRRKGKYTPEERDVIRRERNRIHAKKTRDRKKVFLENSEHTIVEMEKDARLLREYLLNKNLITSAEYNDMKNKEIQCHKELISLRKGGLVTAGIGVYPDEESSEHCDDEDSDETEIFDDVDEDGEEEHQVKKPRVCEAVTPLPLSEQTLSPSVPNSMPKNSYYSTPGYGNMVNGVNLSSPSLIFDNLSARLELERYVLMSTLSANAHSMHPRQFEYLSSLSNAIMVENMLKSCSMPSISGCYSQGSFPTMNTTYSCANPWSSQTSYPSSHFGNYPYSILNAKY